MLIVCELSGDLSVTVSGAPPQVRDLEALRTRFWKHYCLKRLQVREGTAHPIC